MLNNKRGISAIVATVLIILITVAAVTIIWATVIPMISESVSFDDLNVNLKVDTQGGYTFYDEEYDQLFVRIGRGVDEGNIIGLDLVITTQGNSITKSYGLEQVPVVNGFKVIIVEGVTSKPDTVSVVPILSSSEGTGVSGSITSKVNILEGDAVQKGVGTEDINGDTTLTGEPLSSDDCTGKLEGAVCMTIGTCDDLGHCLGNELIVDGEFSEDGWVNWYQTDGGGDCGSGWEILDGEAVLGGGDNCQGYLKQDINSIESGKTYKVKYELSGVYPPSTCGSYKSFIGGVGGQSHTNVGIYTDLIISQVENTYFAIYGSTGNCYGDSVDNVSVREVLG